MSDQVGTVLNGPRYSSRQSLGSVEYLKAQRPGLNDRSTTHRTAS